MKDLQQNYPTPPFREDRIDAPGLEQDMNTKPDFGEFSYKGNGKLINKKAIITGGDSGIGRAVALAYAREGADVLLSYLSEREDAEETARLVREAGRNAVLVAGDVAEEAHCKQLIEKAVSELGGIDILINNAATQVVRESLQEVSAEEWEYTFKANIHSIFYLCKAAEPHLAPGSAVINTTSVNAYTPLPTHLAYSATKGAIQNFTANLAQLWAEKGVRVNCVAPGPIWTPLIPATMPMEDVKKFGSNTPLGRPGQPVELAAAYVYLGSSESSYTTGATIAITGGMPTL